MPLRLDVINPELSLTCLKASLFRGAGVVHDDTSLDVVRSCKWSISILADKLVVAEHKTAVILSISDSLNAPPSFTSRPTSISTSPLITSNASDKSVRVVSQINIDEYEEAGQAVEIGAVLCFPVQTHASTWWTCAAVATTTGLIHFFTDDGRHLAWQRMHTRAAVDMCISTFALVEPGAYAERDFAGLLIYYDDGVCISVEGSHLLQCLDIYRRSKARIFARAAQGGSEELFPLIQFTKLSVAPQAFAYGNSHAQSGEAAEAVPQACIRRKCSRLEQLQNASFLGGFDASVRVTLPTYSIYVSPSIYHSGSSSVTMHELVAFSFVADDHIHISISELASLAADKVKSSVKSTLKSASTLFGLTSALRYGSGRTDAANQPNPEELLNAKRTKAVPAKTVSQEPRFAIDERTGSERQLTRLACSPTGLYVACADNLARVLLVSVLNGLIVHIFKGYRDAQVAWLAPDTAAAASADAVSAGNSDNNSVADVAMQPNESSGRKKSSSTACHERPCLVIYEAKRGLLELWRISQPPQRIFARVVAKNARLLSTSSAMLTTPFWSASSSLNNSSSAGTGESRMAPLSLHSREQRHQLARAKCFLAVSNVSSSTSSGAGSAASPPTRPLQHSQQVIALIPLHLPAYLLHNNEGVAGADDPNTQQHARDLALVQNFKSLVEDLGGLHANANDADTGRFVADLAAAFELIQSDTLKLECVLNIMRNHYGAGLSLDQAVQVLTRLFAAVKAAKQAELESCRDDLKRRLIQGHIWHILDTCLTLLNFYRYATSRQATVVRASNVYEDRPNDAENGLSSLCDIPLNESREIISKSNDIVEAKRDFLAESTSSFSAKDGILSWSEFASQSFDLSSYVKLSPHMLAIRDSPQLAAVLFGPLFNNLADNDSFWTALQNFINSSCFKLNYSRLLLLFVQFWCASSSSPLMQSQDLAMLTRNMRQACQIARHLFSACSNDERNRMLETVERQTSSAACLPVALVFRAVAAEAAAKTDDADMIVDENHNNEPLRPAPFCLTQYQMPSIDTSFPQRIPITASRAPKRRKSFGNDTLDPHLMDVDKSDTPAPTNTADMQIDCWSLTCVRLHDLLAYEHLTALTHKILSPDAAVAEKTSANYQRLQKSCKKLSINDVLNKGGLTEYVAKWLVWTTTPDILKPNDIYRVLSSSSAMTATTLATQLSEASDKKTVGASASGSSGRFFSFRSSSGNNDVDSDDDVGGDPDAPELSDISIVSEDNAPPSSDSRRKYSRSASNSSAKRGAAVKFDADFGKIRSQALERLSNLQVLLPLSLAREDVIANCTWESARAWHEQPHRLVWLRTACRFAQLVQNALVRHGLCSMIWHVVGVSRRLHALSTLCDRNGRMPKDRLVRETLDVGFETHAETLKFLRVTGELLQLSIQTAFATEQSAALLAVVALPDVEQRWSGRTSALLLTDGAGSSPGGGSTSRRTAALLDIAVEQKRVNTDLLQLHALEVELLKVIFALQLRNVKLWSMFTAAETEALKQKLDESKFVVNAHSSAAEQKSVNESRVSFLERLIQATVTNDHHAAPQERHDAQPNMFWYQQAVQFAHCWNMNVDAVVRAPFVYQLYSAGFCRAAQETYESAGDKSESSRRMLSAIGRRIAHALQQRGGDNEAERVIVDELANHLSTSVRTWLRDRDPAGLLQPGIVPLEHCRDMLRLILSATLADNAGDNDASSASMRQSTTTSNGLSHAERAIAGELERELSDVFDMHRIR